MSAKASSEETTGGKGRSSKDDEGDNHSDAGNTDKEAHSDSELATRSKVEVLLTKAGKALLKTFSVQLKGDNFIKVRIEVLIEVSIPRPGDRQAYCQ
jgi:hypothetical protein